MRPFEKVSLNLATLCGAIPLENFLANDYDDSMVFDYREFERETYANRDVSSAASPLSSGVGKDFPDSRADTPNLMDVDNDNDDNDDDSSGMSVVADAGGNPSRAEGDRRLIGEQSSLTIPGLPSGSSSVTPNRSASYLEALGKLYKACKRLSGTVEALNFEFIEENPHCIQCILTVTIPTSQGPSKRSYSTVPTFSNRSDAKGEAAVIAVNMGALDFIKSAFSQNNLSRDKAELLLRAAEDDSVPTKVSDTSASADEQAIQQIDNLCEEWRPGGTVKPEYIIYRPRKSNQIGCALRIALTPHALRIYSTDSEFPSVERAKAACAVLALDEGIGEYIMHGNGQKSKPSHLEKRTQPILPAASPPQLSLQEFFDALPRPFMEPIDKDKDATQIQWSNMFNTIVQGAKLNTLKASFHFRNCETKNGLTGCVLRVSITDPAIVAAVEGEMKKRNALVKTYIVDRHFAKSNDAKTAICIIAITQNLRGYLADIAKAYEQHTQSSREFEKRASEQTLRMISKLRPGKKVTYDVFGSAGKSIEKSKYYGCSLVVDMSPTKGEQDFRSFTTPAPCASKTEVKLAAVLEAAKQGVVELLRFGTVTPTTEKYQTFWDTVCKGEIYDLNASNPTSDDDAEGGITKQEKNRLKRKRRIDRKKGLKKGNTGLQPEGQSSGEESGQISEGFQEKARSKPTQVNQSKPPKNKKQKGQHANANNKRLPHPYNWPYYHHPGSPPLPTGLSPAHSSGYPPSPVYPPPYLASGSFASPTCSHPPPPFHYPYDHQHAPYPMQPPIYPPHHHQYPPSGPYYHYPHPPPMYDLRTRSREFEGDSY